MVAKVYDPSVGGYVEATPEAIKRVQAQSITSTTPTKVSKAEKTVTAPEDTWEKSGPTTYRITRSDGSQTVVWTDEEARRLGVPETLIKSEGPPPIGPTPEEEAYYREQAIKGMSPAMQEAFIEKATVKELEEAGIIEQVPREIVEEKRLKEKAREQAILASPTVMSSFLGKARPEEEAELIRDTSITGLTIGSKGSLLARRKVYEEEREMRGPISMPTGRRILSRKPTIVSPLTPTIPPADDMTPTMPEAEKLGFREELQLGLLTASEEYLSKASMLESRPTEEWKLMDIPKILGLSYAGSAIGIVTQPVESVKGIYQTFRHPVKSVKSIYGQWQEEPLTLYGSLAGQFVIFGATGKAVKKTVVGKKVYGVGEAKTEALKIGELKKSSLYSIKGELEIPYRQRILTFTREGKIVSPLEKGFVLAKDIGKGKSLYAYEALSKVGRQKVITRGLGISKKTDIFIPRKEIIGIGGKELPIDIKIPVEGAFVSKGVGISTLDKLFRKPKQVKTGGMYISKPMQPFVLDTYLSFRFWEGGIAPPGTKVTRVPYFGAQLTEGFKEPQYLKGKLGVFELPKEEFIKEPSLIKAPKEPKTLEPSLKSIVSTKLEPTLSLAVSDISKVMERSIKTRPTTRLSLRGISIGRTTTREKTITITSPRSFISTRTKEKVISLPKEKTSDLLKTGTEQMLRDMQVSESKLKLLPRFKEATGERLKTGTKTVTKQLTTQKQRTGFISLPGLEPILPEIKIPPPFTPFRYKEKNIFGKGKPFKQITGYRPTAGALAFGIYGEKPKGKELWSLMPIRPIVRKRKKKRKKKDE